LNSQFLPTFWYFPSRAWMYFMYVPYSCSFGLRYIRERLLNVFGLFLYMLLFLYLQSTFTLWCQNITYKHLIVLLSRNQIFVIMLKESLMSLDTTHIIYQCNKVSILDIGHQFSIGYLWFLHLFNFGELNWLEWIRKN
jgi:hypothetical protein